MSDPIDLRSDTVTLPTAEMRRAMADAEVGDDCYAEDPTVNALQDLAAEMLGVDGALFVPTGTMANQIAVRVLGAPGGEVICDRDCHLIQHESGACAVLSQVQLRGLDGTMGMFGAEDVRRAVRPPDPYQPRSVLVAVENTHNTAGGTVWPRETIEGVLSAAKEAGLPAFCDGARLFNACVAAGIAPDAYTRGFDLVTISLYKGLAAPMGSLVCGPRELLEEAWRFRRIFGGALRQAGVVAAAGLVALRTMVDRLADDHENARRLAEAMADAAPGGSVPLERVQTNMVLFDAAAAGCDAGRVVASLKAEGVLAGLIAPGVLRFVTHKDVGPGDIGRAATAFRTAIAA